jgi:predicted XRE-type DNA-binding protein
MKREKLKPVTIEELAESWGIDYQVFRAKADLIDLIREYCRKHKISQRGLAAKVPGLTQDRVSKIFSGRVGHMTVDKLIEIASALGITVTVSAKMKVA